MYEDLVPSVQRMKNTFVYALWSWSRSAVVFQSLVVTDFFVYVGYRLGAGFVSLSPCFVVLDFWTLGILHVW